MWDAGSVNVAKNVIDVCFAIIQYLLITIVIGFVVKKIVDKSLEKQKHIGENLSKYGIHKVSAHKGGTLNEKDKNVLFGKRGRVFPEEVDLCFLTGWSFFRDYCEELKNLVANGTKIRVMLGSPEGATFTGCQIEQTQKLLKKMTEYYAAAYLNRSPLKSFLERETLMLAHENLADAANEREAVMKKLEETVLQKDGEFVGDHIYQIYVINKLLSELRAYAKDGGEISLHYYCDEYQMPIIMAKYPAEKKKEPKTLLWTNMNAPIRETKDSINLYCEATETKHSLYINDVQKSFDYLYNRYSEEQLK